MRRRTTARVPKPKADGTYRKFQTEDELRQNIEMFARQLGYRVMHDELARGYYKGFPDIAICGHGLLIFVECKGPNGSTTDAQEGWIADLQLANQPVIVASTEDDEMGYDLVTTILMDQYEWWQKQ